MRRGPGVWWIIEHKAKGTYLGLGRHPRTRETLPLFRSADTRKPALLFGSIAAAAQELDMITTDDRDFEIIPLR